MNIERQLIFLFLIFNLLNISVLADEGSRITFEATGLSLLKPSGFDIAEAFYGFQQEKSGASVLVSTIPGPYLEVSKGFEKSTLAEQGISVISAEEIKIADHEGSLLYVSQTAYGREYHKWIATFGDETRTSLVTASFPATEKSSLSEKMRSAVLSALPITISHKPHSVPFLIGDVGGLSEFKGAAALGKLRAFTKNGVIPLASPTDPLFIVAASLGKVAVGDREDFAVQRLNGTANVTVTKLVSSNRIEIDKLTGFEIEALGRDQKSGEELLLYQVILYPPDGGYVLMTAMCGTAEANTYLDKFKALARTYRANIIAAK